MFVWNHMSLVVRVIVIHTDGHVHRCAHTHAIYLSIYMKQIYQKQIVFELPFLPGVSRGRGSLVGCRLWGHTESNTTEVT